MKTKLLYFLSYCLLCSLLIGRVIEDLTIKSEILNEELNYSVYLPPDYDSSERYYPVVYLLHGYSDDDSGWIQFGEAPRICDEAILEGKIAPMILIMPDARVSFYINNSSGSYRFEDYFIEELMPHVESQFRIRQKQEYRGLCGLSMGGYGATILGLRHPDLFSGFAALSAALLTPEKMVEEQKARWDRMFAPVFGKQPSKDEAYDAHMLSYNPHLYVANKSKEDLNDLHMYIDCGDDDFLIEGNLYFHILLKKSGLEHEFRIRDGAHNWSYWRKVLPDALAFLSEKFHR